MPTINDTVNVKIVIDPAKLAEFLTGANGPVYREFINRATLVQAGAKRQVGKRTHKLEGSIVKRTLRTPNGFQILVGSELPYTLFHHEGTRPHIIRPRTATHLVFFWDKVGHVVAFKSVNHPGTKSNRFLTDNMHYFVGK